MNKRVEATENRKTRLDGDTKSTVLFVGGFGRSEDGAQGGQVFACRSLLSSPLSQFINWRLVDSTQRSEPPPGLIVRTWDAAVRCLLVLRYLLFSRVNSILVFTSLIPLSIAEKGLYCLLGRCFGKRVVIAIRSQPYFPRRFVGIYRWLVSRSLNCSSRIICQSDFVAEELKREFRTNPDRIEIIPNWLDTRVFFPITKTNAPGAASLSLVYVGWLNADKGVEYLLQATKLLSMKRSDFHLTLYGGGDLEARLKLQSNELEIAKLVTFHGWIDNKEVPDALNRGDIFVFPSLKEGMPNSLLQAMACGLPVIATRISSIPGLIAEGRNGLLVDPKSSGQLAIAIESLLDSPKLREQMGAKNAEQIRQFHCLEKAWEKVGKILLPELKIAPDRLDNAN